MSDDLYFWYGNVIIYFHFIFYFSLLDSRNLFRIHLQRLGSRNFSPLKSITTATFVEPMTVFWFPAFSCVHLRLIFHSSSTCLALILLLILLSHTSSFTRCLHTRGISLGVARLVGSCIRSVWDSLGSAHRHLLERSSQRCWRHWDG